MCLISSSSSWARSSVQSVVMPFSTAPIST
uniref:Uncharacterized protein n=1 Tax=Arundo donax TaxID=35708 RepID=A0A0A9T0T8_ARUDO